MKRILMLLVLLLGLGLMAVPVFASQIYVCTGCTNPPGGDPNIIDPASINVGFAGNHTAVSPLLIIVGVPNAGPAPTLSLPTGVNPAVAGAYYGLNSATSGTTAGVLVGTLTSANSGQNDAYTQSGLLGGNNSNNWTNWSGFDTAHGFTVGSSFNLYAYAIDYALKNGGTGDNSPITIDFENIAAGSFVIAYNCEEAGPTCTGGNVGDTPFTNAGAVVPEPASLLLLGSGLFGLGAWERKRLRAKRSELRD